MPDPTMSIRAVGPATEGRLALSEVARLAGELQATLERLALNLRGGSSTPGRRPRDIADAVKLELVGFRRGSTILEMAPPGAIMNHGLLDESSAALISGMEAIAKKVSRAPTGFNSQVLDGLIRFSGGISDQTIRRLEISWPGHAVVIVDREFREHARWLRRQTVRDVVSIVGRLHEGDFDPLALRCRIDTLDATIACSFGSDMREVVLAAMDCMVVATGIADMQLDGRVRALALDELTVIEEAQRRTVEELAREQGVDPVQDLSQFATMTDLDDDEYESFVGKAMSSRSRQV